MIELCKDNARWECISRSIKIIEDGCTKENPFTKKLVELTKKSLND
jgi:hypothetical protein